MVQERFKHEKNIFYIPVHETFEGIIHICSLDIGRLRGNIESNTSSRTSFWPVSACRLVVRSGWRSRHHVHVFGSTSGFAEDVSMLSDFQKRMDFDRADVHKYDRYQTYAVQYYITTFGDT